MKASVSALVVVILGLALVHGWNSFELIGENYESVESFEGHGFGVDLTGSTKNPEVLAKIGAWRYNRKLRSCVIYCQIRGRAGGALSFRKFNGRIIGRVIQCTCSPRPEEPRPDPVTAQY
jgi:hypothetical protein